MSRLEVAELAPGALDGPFWEGWKDGEQFLLHCCDICARHEWPATCCLEHGSAPMRWVKASGVGVVDTFTVFRRAYTQDLAAEVPYAVAVVRLDEGPYFHTRIVGVPVDRVESGMRVRVRRGAADLFPLFEPIA